MAEAEHPDEPATGYRRPPRETRFRKGRSGNPGGRPRHARDLVLLLTKALDRPAVIVEDGKRRRATKREAIAAQLVDRSAQADLHATKLLLGLLAKIGPPPREPEPADLDEADAKVIATLLERLGMGQ